MDSPAKSPSSPATIRVVASSGGFRTFVAFVAAMFVFAVVFIIGLVAGATAGSGDEGPVLARTVHDGKSATIVQLDVTGIIDGGTAEYVHAAVDRILRNDDVRAVVPRVDSPGGGATASDEIWHQIDRLKTAGLPVVASYGGMAASGGYYISCGADHILAQPTTVTGSIGVIASILTMEGLMDLIGVTPVTMVASGSPRKSVANDVYRDWTPRDKAAVGTILDAMYEEFADRVRSGRAHVIGDDSTLDSIADGSIYTARAALENGLIDGIGYLDDAITAAKTRGSLGEIEPTIIRYSRKEPMLGLFGLSSGTPADVRRLIDELAMPRLMFLHR